MRGAPLPVLLSGLVISNDPTPVAGGAGFYGVEISYAGHERDLRRSARRDPGALSIGSRSDPPRTRGGAPRRRLRGNFPEGSRGKRALAAPRQPETAPSGPGPASARRRGGPRRAAREARAVPPRPRTERRRRGRGAGRADPAAHGAAAGSGAGLAAASGDASGRSASASIWPGVRRTGNSVTRPGAAACPTSPRPQAMPEGPGGRCARPPRR